MGGVSPGFPCIIQSHRLVALFASPKRPIRNRWGEVTVLWSRMEGGVCAWVQRGDWVRECWRGIASRTEWSEAEWIVCALEIEIQLCDSNWVSQNWIITSLIETPLQAFCVSSTLIVVIFTGWVLLVHSAPLFISAVLFFSVFDKMKLDSLLPLSLASSPSLSDSFLVEDNTL